MRKYLAAGLVAVGIAGALPATVGAHTRPTVREIVRVLNHSPRMQGAVRRRVICAHQSHWEREHGITVMPEGCDR